MNIASLRAKRAEVNDRIKATLDKAIAEARGLTAEEETQVSADEKEISGIDSLIERAEKHQAEMARTAEPAPAAGVRVEDPKREKGHGISRIIRSLAFARGDRRAAAQHCEQVFHDAEIAKALAAGSGPAGGFVVPENYTAELIEFLRPKSIVRAMGGREIPLVNGNMSMPKVTSGSAASYIGENTTINKTEPGFGLVRLTAKKMAALTPISNDLIRFSSPSADAFVREDLVAAIAQCEDVNFLRSDGTGAAPKGLRYWAAAANLINVNATVNLDNVTKDTTKLRLALENANIRMGNPKWMMSPRTRAFLEDLRNANGVKEFPEISNGMFRGYAYGVSNNIPNNLSVTDTNESELYFVDFDEVLIGDVPGIEIAVSSEAAYNDGNNVVAAFSNDQTIIRVIMHNDLAVRHAEAVAVLVDVDWGA